CSKQNRLCHQWSCKGRMKIIDTQGHEVLTLGSLHFHEVDFAVTGNINDADWNSTFMKLLAGGVGAGFNLTGIIPPPVFCPLVIIYNKTGYTMTIKHVNLSSASLHRIWVKSLGDQAVADGGSATLLYDYNDSVWRIVALV